MTFCGAIILIRGFICTQLYIIYSILYTVYNTIYSVYICEKALNSGVMRIDEKWEAVAPMKLPRMGLSCSVFRGRIWACGGKNGTQRYNSCEAYHPTVRINYTKMLQMRRRLFYNILI